MSHSAERSKGKRSVMNWEDTIRALGISFSHRQPVRLRFIRNQGRSFVARENGSSMRSRLRLHSLQKFG